MSRAVLGTWPSVLSVARGVIKGAGDAAVTVACGAAGVVGILAIALAVATARE